VCNFNHRSCVLGLDGVFVLLGPTLPETFLGAPRFRRWPILPPANYEELPGVPATGALCSAAQIATLADIAPRKSWAKLRGVAHR
jgi:hypothetical protein